MVKKDLFFISLIIVLFITSSVFFWQQTQQNFSIAHERDSPLYHDFDNHLRAARNDGTAPNMDYYPPLSKWVGHLFSFNPLIFYLFWVLIIFLVVPSLLAFLLKSNLAYFFYYVFSFSFVFDLGAYYSQFLFGIWSVLMFFVTDRKVKLFLVLLGFLTHSFAGEFLLFVWVLQELFDKKEQVVLMCAGSLGSQVLPVVDSIKSVGNVLYELFLLFFKQVNIVFVFVAFREWFLEKEYVFIVSFFALLGMGLFFGHRVWLMLGFLVLIGLVRAVEKMSVKWRWMIYVYSCVFIVWNLYSWYVNKLGNLTGVC